MAPQQGINFNLFKQYDPSQPACIVFLVLFTLLFLAHTFQALKARVLWLLPLLIATGMESAGYILRELCIRNRTDRNYKNPFIVSQVFVIAAPALLAGNLYMFVGRAMSYGGNSYALIRPTRITATFVGVDVFSILAQAAGAALLFNPNATSVNNLQRARVILDAGLFIQIIGFAVFLFVAIWFDYKSTQALKDRISHIRALMNAFYVSGALILLRSIYRIVEFMTVDFNARPIGGYLYTTEWPYYVLDALPILFSIFVFNIIYPPNYLPRSRKDTLEKDQHQLGEVTTMGQA